MKQNQMSEKIQQVTKYMIDNGILQKDLMSTLPERDIQYNNSFYAPGTQIAYDVNLVPKLKNDHKDLLELYALTMDAVDRKNLNKIKRHSENFLHLFNSHILLEYTKLYIFLNYAFSDENDYRTVIHEFRKEMNLIGKTVRTFFNSWKGEILNQENLPSFRHSLSEIGAVLLTRIKTEEELLYEIYRHAPRLIQLEMD